MESLDYHSKGPQVQWTSSKRTLLCCLFRFFRRDGNAFRKIFTSIFMHDLSQFDGDVPFSTLSTQWYDMRRYGDPIWHEVNIDIPFPPEGPWLAVVARIKDQARAIGVSLVEKEDDDIDTSNFRLDPLRRSRGRPTLSQTPSQTVLTPGSVRTVETQSSLPSQAATVPRPPGPEPLCTAGGKMCYWCFQEAEENGQNQRLKADEDIPSLLYRWSNVESQGVNTRLLVLSGLFADTEQRFFGPDEISRSEFDEFFTKHVSIVKSSSPFVSTFKSLLAPVHRALRAREGAIVSIVDSSRLQTEVYSAQRVVREIDIRISGYRGFGEYLIWGRIPTPAIVCSFTISELVRIAEEDKDIGRLLQLGEIESSQRNRGKPHRTLSQGPGQADRRSGLTVGRLLGRLNLPNSHVETVGMSIFYSWRFSKKGNLEDYLKGVKDGYLMPNAVPTAPETLPSPGQSDFVVDPEELPADHLEEEEEDLSDDSLVIGEEDGDGDIVPTIESPCPAPRDQQGAARVEFFDPRAQRWSENATGMAPVDEQDGEIDQEMEFVIDELMSLTE